MMFIDVYEPSSRNPFGQMPWNLLRAIAIIQLYLEERWVEPFELKAKPFSLLAHQTLSTLMTFGELSPSELARNVLMLPAFQKTVSQEEYRKLLQHMLANDYLQRIEGGNIIVGLKGERITNHYSFYAVFQDEQVYHVLSQEGEIGTLDSCLKVGEVFILAGRTWQVRDVDEERKIIYVNRCKNNQIPHWKSSGGRIHTKIIHRIRQILSEDIKYNYLQPKASQVIDDARFIAREAGILQKSIIPYAERSFYLCPWVGSKSLQTIQKLLECSLKDSLRIRSVSEGHHYLQITSDLSIDEFTDKLSKIQINYHDPDLVLPENQVPRVDKYDKMVPDELLRVAFLYNELDLKSAVEVLKGL
jgi:ATP-dependent helicase Lhr and Lhr-like helicase